MTVISGMRSSRPRQAAEACLAGADHPLGDEGTGTLAIVTVTGKSKTCVWRWQERFMREGVDGLLCGKSRPRPPGRARVPPGQVDEIVRLTREPPPLEATRWMFRAMATVAGVSASTAQAIWSL